MITVAFQCLIMIWLDSLYSSRNLQVNYAISFLFRLDLILHACNIPVRCDSFGILNFATKQDLSWNCSDMNGSYELCDNNWTWFCSPNCKCCSNCNGKTCTLWEGKKMMFSQVKLQIPSSGKFCLVLYAYWSACCAECQNRIWHCILS